MILSTDSKTQIQHPSAESGTRVRGVVVHVGGETELRLCASEVYVLPWQTALRRINHVGAGWWPLFLADMCLVCRHAHTLTVYTSTVSPLLRSPYKDLNQRDRCFYGYKYIYIYFLLREF